MRRFLSSIAIAALLVTLAVSSASAQFENQPPPLYDVVINGETFSVSEGVKTKVESKKQPGVTYDLLVRASEYQPWQLNSLKFLFHQGFAIRDDEKPTARTATLKHRLGFYVLLTDLGGPVPAESRQKALNLIVADTEKSLVESGATNIKKSAPAERKFGGVDSLGITIDFVRDKSPTRMLVLVLGTTDIGATGIVEYLTEDQDNVAPLVRKTFESLAPIK